MQKRPQGLGANFTMFQPEVGSSDDLITIEYDGPICSNNHVIAFARKFEGLPIYEEYVVQLDDEGRATFELGSWDATEWMFMVVPMTRLGGSASWDFVFSAETDWTPMEADELPEPTRIIRLDPNRPNPFHPMTMIEYTLPEAAQVRVDVYDASGRHVRTLVDGAQGAGGHEVVWNGDDDAGRMVSSGLYFYALQVGDERIVRKMLYVE
jgi:hypothetical protein